MPAAQKASGELPAGGGSLAPQAEKNNRKGMGFVKIPAARTTKTPEDVKKECSWHEGDAVSGQPMGVLSRSRLIPWSSRQSWNSSAASTQRGKPRSTALRQSFLLTWKTMPPARAERSRGVFAATGAGRFSSGTKKVPRCAPPCPISGNENKLMRRQNYASGAVELQQKQKGSP